MADIAWAAHWIKAGRVVRREAWDYEEVWDGIRRGGRDGAYYLLGRTGLTYEDLVADDWCFGESSLIRKDGAVGV